MYDEKLEKLIEMALVDGELTEKEKQILFKKAEAMNVDLDEFEMVLEAKLYEKQQSKQSLEKPVSAAPKSDKFGDVKKCPSCGSMIQSFQTKCSDCGHDYSNIDANASIDKLFKMLNEAEDTRKDNFDSNPMKAIGSSIAKEMFGGRGPSNVDKKKMEIIANFPIPTTKNDIIEFLSLAVPKAKEVGNFFSKGNPENKTHNEFVPVWKTKCEQIIMKAKFSMKEDPKSLEEILYYAKELGIK